LADTQKYDPSLFEEVAPTQDAQASTEDYLTGKAKLPGGAAGLLSPEAKRFRAGLSKDALNAVAGSLVPEGTPNPLGWIAEKTGLSKIPDKIMQGAVGLKKFIPGVGDELMSQGVYGTKGMMQKQIAKKLDMANSERDAILAALPGKVDSAPVAERVAKLGKQFSTPGGIVPSEVAPEFGKVADAAKEIAARGELSAPEAGKLASIAGNIGYRGEKPVERIAGKIAQQEHAGYRKALEELGAKAGAQQPFPEPNKVAEVYSKLSPLTKASKAINKPVTESTGMLSLKDYFGGAAGGAVAGPVGIPIGVALAKFLGTPVGKASAAYALKGAGKAVGQAPARIAGRMATDESGQPVVDSTPAQAMKYDPTLFEEVKK
jgi:hypothetical protein